MLPSIFTLKRFLGVKTRKTHVFHTNVNPTHSFEIWNKPQLKTFETVRNIFKPWSICSGGSQGLGFRGVLSEAKPFQSHSKPFEGLIILYMKLKPVSACLFNTSHEQFNMIFVPPRENPQRKPWTKYLECVDRQPWSLILSLKLENWNLTLNPESHVPTINLDNQVKLLKTQND